MFEKLKSIDDAPFNLLLLADPSMDMVLEKLNKGECFLYKVESEVIGCYVLNRVTRNRVELVNIAVSEKNQGCGMGKQLILHAFDYAKESGYSEIVVGTAILVLDKSLFIKKQGLECLR